MELADRLVEVVISRIREAIYPTVKDEYHNYLDKVLDQLRGEIKNHALVKQGVDAAHHLGEERAVQSVIRAMDNTDLITNIRMGVLQSKHLK